MHFASNTAVTDGGIGIEEFTGEGDTVNHILLEQLFDRSHVEMTKTSMHEVEGNVGVRRVIDFRWNIRSSVGGYVVKIVEVLSHSAKEDDVASLRVRDSAFSVNELDSTSSFVKFQDGEERDVR